MRTVELPKYFDRRYFLTLRLLSDNPKVRFYQRDVAKAVGVSIEAANRMLKLLAEEGMVRRETRGKAKVYRFDRFSPLARQVRVLFNLADLNDFIPRAIRYARKLVLIGKCAEGTDSAEDPIEMLAVPKGRGGRLLDEAEKYEAKLGRSLEIRLASMDEVSKVRGIQLI